MARAAVIGDSLRIGGYALAGAIVCPAEDGPQAISAWRGLPGDVTVVVLTESAATWLARELAARPGVLPVVLPDLPASAQWAPVPSPPVPSGPNEAAPREPA